MKTINHWNIRLIREDLTAYDAIIDCGLPLPKFIIDSKGSLFLKNRTIFESGEVSRVVYSQTLVTFLNSVEVVAQPVEAKVSFLKP